MSVLTFQDFVNELNPEGYELFKNTGGLEGEYKRTLRQQMITCDVIDVFFEVTTNKFDRINRHDITKFICSCMNPDEAKIILSRTLKLKGIQYMKNAKYRHSKGVYTNVKIKNQYKYLFDRLLDYAPELYDREQIKEQIKEEFIKVMNKKIEIEKLKTELKIKTDLHNRLLEEQPQFIKDYLEIIKFWNNRPSRRF